MKNPFKAIRQWRDQKFRERIDRVYFRHNGNGLRFIDGVLVAVKDEKTGRPGSITAGAELSYDDAKSDEVTSFILRSLIV